MDWKKLSLTALFGGALAVSGCGGSDGGGSGGADGTTGGTVTGGAVVDVGTGGSIVADATLPDASIPACSDGADNDGDGKVDLDDPGCENATDRDEFDPPPPPACSDGLDNDSDGYTDFPADPGCGSNLDDTEDNAAPAPQCNDGIDNDQDELVDEQDPGCTSAADPSEEDPAERPACSDGLDNDGDGVIDFPFEPGCRSAGDPEEDDPPNAPDCADGQDNDSDGKVDYPDDPGCAGAGDSDETDKAVTPACSDGLDNDRDGLIDYPQDDGCASAADYDERGSCGDRYDPPLLANGQTVTTDISRGIFRSNGSCGGQGNPEVVFLYRVSRVIQSLDISTVGPGTTVPTAIYARRRDCLDPGAEVGCHRDDLAAATPGHVLSLPNPEFGDYYIFVDGANNHAGPVQVTVTEVDLPQCSNQVDDDGNGRIDYPSDPGCSGPDDREEVAPAEPPACSNDLDDDGDGLVDYPIDQGCISAAGESEVDRCGQGVRFAEFPVDQPFVLGDTSTGTNTMSGSCGGANEKEIIYHYANPFNARLTFNTNFPETGIPTVLYIRRDCATRNTELAAPMGCDDGQLGGTQHGRLTIDRASAGDYWVVVDTRLGAGGAFKLSVDVHRLDPGCSDGRDGDGDGEIDGDDPGCSGPDDETEDDPPAGTPAAACANDRDDDGDGFTDYPEDPGCTAMGDTDEADPATPPQCANGIDDDDDGRTDYPTDGGCQSRGDDNERNPVPSAACSNALDDDQDSRTDYPQDPGCRSAGDSSEADPATPPVCFDGVDNDRDGIADFPFDPGCASAADMDESDPAAADMPACSNGLDDDGDGVIDFPLDYGCAYAADETEQGAALAPACGNRRDDDGDGRIDFPDDPGCRFAADNDETNVGALPPRCNDGVDNDFDGFIDFRDIGCLDAEDNDEADPAEVPLCGDDVDNDGDGTTDWPDDVGCQARGDLTEDQSCQPGVQTPLVPQNGSVSGATLMDGSDNYYSRCGGRFAPDAVYKYVLDAQANVTFSLDNPGTDYPAVISVRNDCEEPTSLLGCAGNFAHPTPTVTLNNAAPGEYYIFVDGGGPERWISSGNAMVVPPSPDAYVPSQADLTPQNWGDGGNDAFDGYGATSLTFGGVTQSVDISVGRHQGNVNGYAYTATSDFPSPSVWRMRIEPAVDFDDRLVDFRLGDLMAGGGNMGCDRDCLDPHSIEFDGRQINYFTSTDQFDPDTVQMLVPSDPEQVGLIRYDNNNDNVQISAAGIKLPVTMYVAVTNANLDAVAAAIITDIELQAGPGGPDAQRFGNFELTVQEN